MIVTKSRLPMATKKSHIGIIIAVHLGSTILLKTGLGVLSLIQEANPHRNAYITTQWLRMR